MDGLMHTLFALEDRKLLRITNADGLICLRAEIFDGGIHAAVPLEAPATRKRGRKPKPKA